MKIDPRRVLCMLAVTAACGLLVPASASAHHIRGSWSVDLLCNGSPCESTSWRGDRWIVGEYGVRYVIRVTNHTARWTEAVLTVDGRDVVNGSRGSWSNRGYLLAPWESIDVEGFRTSDHHVAAFRFTSVPDSYAGRVDGGQNAGVVAAAFFPGDRKDLRPMPVRPDPRPHPHPEPWYGERGGADDAAEAAPGSAGRPAPRTDSRSKTSRRPPRDRGEQQHLGTRFGERRWSSVTEVDFSRDSSRPTRTVQLRYDDRSGLRSKGVPVPERGTRRPRPTPGRGTDGAPRLAATVKAGRGESLDSPRPARGPETYRRPTTPCSKSSNTGLASGLVTNRRRGSCGVAPRDIGMPRGRVGYIAGGFE